MTTEQHPQDKGLIAPSVTLSSIAATIVSEAYHVFPNTCLTVCCLTLRNGFNVIGESACVSPENFNAEVGEKIAYANAVQKIWVLEGYSLKQRMFQGASAWDLQTK
jgi:hypothetical protein